MRGTHQPVPSIMIWEESLNSYKPFIDRWPDQSQTPFSSNLIIAPDISSASPAGELQMASVWSVVRWAFHEVYIPTLLPHPLGRSRVLAWDE